MDNFLRNVRNSSPEKQTPPDDWRKGPVWPLIRDGSRDDFKARESSESNPANYVVEIFPKPDSDHLDQSKTYKAIMRGSRVSGLIDLRTNNEEKYTIWFGKNHMELMGEAAKIPDDPNTRQYFISIKVGGQRDKNIRIDRRTIGISCNRTLEHIDKILDAVDIALKNTFKL